MTPPLLLATALLGGVGACLRFLLDSAVQRRVRTPLPVGTALINVSGSLALGLLTGLASRWLGSDLLVVLGTGLLGGYTTFSTASAETVRLLLARRASTAVFYGLGVLVLAVVAALLGLAVGRAV